MSTIDLVRRERNTTTFAAGEKIFQEGDPGDCMYAVDSGEVEIVKGTRTLETISGGGIFGEMGLVNSKPRMASAVAKTGCTVVRLDQGDFYFLIQHAPFFAIQVMQVLAERVRQNTEA
jgi:CRP/FNR family transcriptional regulator, cyclic AMP receptor protein